MIEIVTLYCSYPLCKAPVQVEGAGHELSPYFPGRCLEGNLGRCPKLQQALNLAGHQIRLLGAAPLRPLFSRIKWLLLAAIAINDKSIFDLNGLFHRKERFDAHTKY
jgi:hypothetical protein